MNRPRLVAQDPNTSQPSIAIVAPVRSFTSPSLTLLYPWVSGAVLNAATIGGSDRRSLERFQLLPDAPVHRTVATVLDAHVTIAAAGFVAVDLYDGCLLYDSERLTVHLIDLDEYRPGGFTLDADRQPGSLSYMAPEESQRGAVIDERTTVFNLGRMIHHLLSTAGGWRGSDAQATVVAQATSASPHERFGSVAELSAAWVGSREPTRRQLP